MFIDTSPGPESAAAYAAYLAGQRERWGFVPDYAACFASKPEVAQAWSVLAAAAQAGLPRRRFEIATIAAAHARRSTYCTVAHSHFLREACDDEATVRSIAADPSGSALAAEDAVVYRFAATVARDPAAIEQADIDELRAHGLTDAEIADLAYVVGVRLFFSAVLDALGARLDARTAAKFEPEVLAPLVVGREPLTG